MFFDRVDAGKKLTKELQQFKGKKNALILAMPRGGVVVGKEIARELNLSLDIVVTRKIGAPGNKEYAIGAVAEKGEPVINDEVIGTMDINPDYLDHTITSEREEIKRRLQVYRDGKPEINLKNKIVLLVDDGVATGFSVLAAVRYLRLQSPKKIILVTPVISASTLDYLKKEFDQIVFLEAPRFFYAVGQFYENFQEVSDDEVVKLLRD